ncbi:uncharacterized protein LOC117122898, partial [Anneissia japonica]|uniref:uncharacterized protein LOC117122898 n=1 Tax=Anneissia japonica TaxID=1529436 RepID=UPI001425643E
MKENPPTRRGILSTVSAVFDPLGLIGPYILQGKRILQNVCAEVKDWDEPLNDDTIQHWISWKEQLRYLSNIKISRCYKAPNATGKVSSVELHHFSDASTSGYGQCSYLRLVHEDGTVRVSLVMSKCRVTPLKRMTIPRLELTAAMVSARIARILREELKYPNLVEPFWSDSKVALGYISNESRRFHVFVANRVQTIHNLSEPTQWHYIASEENPADIASRGSSVEELLDCDLWWQGPKFLSELIYKIEDYPPEPIHDTDVEVKRVRVQATHVSVQTIPEMLKRYSSWSRASRVLALCIVFSYKCRSWKISGDLTTQDIDRAKKLMVKATQHNQYKELDKLTRLDPVVDQDGLIR